MVRWQGRRQSSNIEDRRGQTGGGLGGGFGRGGLGSNPFGQGGGMRIPMGRSGGGLGGNWGAVVGGGGNCGIAGSGVDAVGSTRRRNQPARPARTKPPIPNPNATTIEIAQTGPRPLLRFCSTG